MAEPRPFPPSPRRLALARASGVTAVSPLLVGAAATVAVAVAVFSLGSAAAAQLGHWIAGACAAADGAHVGGTTSDAGALPFAHVAGAVLELALPLLAAAAIAALIVHVAQTRGLWLPRRSVPGAPRIPRHDVTRTALDLAGAIVIGAVCLGWLWTTAPQLARLVESPRAAGAALASLLATLAIAWVALGVIDALVRHVELSSALAMTRDEKRDDDRLAAADPRWRAQRLSVMRGNTSDAVARSAIVLLGDDLAIAVAWDPARQPIPLRVATGRRARATQLVALARRHRIAVHRDSDLAARLVDHEGPVPESDWPRLAEIIAAVRR